MLNDGNVVFLDLLLYLEDVQVCRELIDLTSADGVNEAGFSDTIATNETVLAAFDKFEDCIIQQGLASYDNCHTSHVNVLFEALAFVVTHLRLGNAVLIAHELGNFFVKCIFSFQLSLCCHRVQLACLELGVLVSFRAINSRKGVQEVFVAYSNALQGHLVEDDGIG